MIRWAGSHALLVDCAGLEEVMALHAHLRAHPLPGQQEAIAAATTVLVTFHTRTYARAAVRTLGDVVAPPRASGAAATVELDVVYDGYDLADVARLTGRSTDALIAWHTGTTWVGAFGGFAPGFTYLVDADGGASEVPRRVDPRTRVPAGSVALASGFSAVYPRDSPGGWQLIGHTNARMWDLHREPPALVRPGDEVRYRAVRDRALLSETPPPTPAPTSTGTGPGTGTGEGAGTATSPASPGPALVVEDPGMQTLVEDLGRHGHGDLGVSASGAADVLAARSANRILGNDEGAAVIEALMGGASVRARGHLVLSLTGAQAVGRITPAAAESGAAGAAADAASTRPRPAPVGEAFALYDGETLTLDDPDAGLRTYIGVRGGIDVPAVLGSRSTDAMSGIGPEPLTAGTVLRIGAVAPTRPVGLPEDSPIVLPRPGEVTDLRVILGPREDWFDADSLARFTAVEWQVSSRSNRIGVRFELPDQAADTTDTTDTAGAPPLRRSRAGELPTEGTVPGSLQVPPNGLPVLFLADHPVTGGYPIIGVVVADDLSLAAQLPPGSAVRFVPVDPDAAPYAPSSPRPSHELTDQR